jgi:hypothetical protein
MAVDMAAEPRNFLRERVPDFLDCVGVLDKSALLNLNKQDYPKKYAIDIDNVFWEGKIFHHSGILCQGPRIFNMHGFLHCFFGFLIKIWNLFRNSEAYLIP